MHTPSRVLLYAHIAVALHVAGAATPQLTPTSSRAPFADAAEASQYLASCADKTNVNECISRAAAQAVASGRPLLLPPGVFPVSAWKPPCPLVITGAGEGKTILERPARSGGNVIAFDHCRGLTINNLTIDGNRAANDSVGYTLVLGSSAQVHIDNLEIRNSKGMGSALTIQDSEDDPNLTSSSFSKLNIHDNDGNGVYFQRRASNWTVSDSSIRDNGGVGLTVIDYEFPPSHARFSNCGILRNNISHNKGNGISVTSGFTGGSAALPVYGPYDTVRNCRITENQVSYNGHYGIIMAGGFQIDIGANTATHNGTGTSTGIAGINSALCEQCTVHDNTSEYNDFYGIDAGGALHSTFQRNVISNNGNAMANNGNGINCGACRYVEISDNTISRNGWTGGGAQIHVTRYDAATAAFPFPATNISMIRNRLVCGQEPETGLLVLADPPETVVEENSTEKCQPLKGYVLHLTAGRINGNHQDNWMDRSTAVPSSAGIYPDGADELSVPRNFDVNSTELRPFFYSKNYHTVYAVVVTNGGSSYSTAPKVRFYGGCDSKPAGSALQDDDGHIVGVNLSSFGAGCRDSPTVIFEDKTGTGATAKAFVLDALPIEGRVLRIHWASGLHIRKGWSGVTFIGNEDLEVSGDSNNLSILQGQNGAWQETQRQ